MNKLLNSLIAGALIIAISIGIAGVYVSEMVLAANLGKYSLVYDSSSVAYITSYGLPVSVQGALQAQGIDIKSSNTSNYSVDGNNGFMCISAGRSSPTGTGGAVYRCVNEGIYNNSSDSSDASHNTLQALSGLTYSQIVYGCYSVGKGGGSSWAFAHAVLSHLIGEDSSWFGPIASSTAYSSLTTFAGAAASSARSCAPDAPFYVFLSDSGRQNLIAMNYHKPNSASVTFDKTDGSSGLSNAVIRFTSSVPGAFDNISVSGVSYSSVEGGIEFVTNGSQITIDGLKTSCSYLFHEVTPPPGFRAAADITVNVDANGNVSNSLDHDGSVVMIDSNLPLGAVSFNKIDSVTGDDSVPVIRTAGIEFYAAPDNTVADAMSDLTVDDNTGTAVYDKTGSATGYPRITFTASASGTDITIRGLKPGASYIFHEYQVPQHYVQANDIQVTVMSDGSVRVNGNVSNGFIVMENAERPVGEFGSLAIVKKFDNNDPVAEQNFWSNVGQVDFYIYWGGNEGFDTASRVFDLYGQTGYTGGLVTEGTLRPSNYDTNSNPANNPNEATVWWNAPDGGIQDGLHSLTDSDYNLDNPLDLRGRWYQTWDPLQGRFHEWPNEACPAMTWLPKGYYLVTETWQEGAMLDQNFERIYIDTLNASGWHEMSRSDSGLVVYGQVFFVEGGFTSTVDWNSGEVTGTCERRESMYGDVLGDDVFWNYYVGTAVVNEENTGALDLEKIDMSGTGVDGLSFELWRGASRYATGHIASGISPSVNGDGFYTYPVNWNYTTTSCVDRRNDIWTTEYHTDSDAVYNLNYGSYQIREIVPEGRTYRTPEGWSAHWTEDGRADFFYIDVDVTAADQTVPHWISVGNREYRLNVEVTKKDSSTDSIIAHYSGDTPAEFALYWDVNSNGRLDSRDQLLAELSDTQREGKVIFDLNLGEIFPEMNESSYPESYLVVETSAPEGYYINNEPIPVTLNRSNDYRNSVTVFDTPYIRFTVNVNKVDASTSAVIANYEGDHDVVFKLYCDINRNGILDDEDIYMNRLSDTDRDGVVTFAYVLTPEFMAARFPDIDDPLNYPTEYLVVETQAPDGYYLDSRVHPVSLRARRYSTSSSVNVEDIPYVDITFKVKKYDEWTGHILAGYEGEYSASFRLYCDINCNGALDDADILVDTLTDTDHDGRITQDLVLTPSVLEELFPGVDNPLDYPTRYLLVETVSPYDYYINPDVIPIEIDPGKYSQSVTVRVNETPYSSEVRIYKLDSENGEEIRTAQFTIYSDTDGNGRFTEGVDQLANSFIDGESRPAVMSWNEEELCYVSSPLRSGCYVIVETGLPDGYFYVDEGGNPTLIPNEVYFEIEGKDTSADNFAVTYYNATVYNVAPHISTTLTNTVTLSHVAPVGQSVQLSDVVSYRNLVPGLEYVLTGTLMDRHTGDPITDGSGAPVSSRITFTPAASDGTVEVIFNVNTEYLLEQVDDGQAVAPRDIVAFEDLDLVTGEDVCEHEDKDDAGQTVRIGEIHTGAVDLDTRSQMTSHGLATIVDYVYYEGLQPGREYTVTGTMHLISFDDNGNRIDEGVITEGSSEECLRPVATFTPESHEGIAAVIYVVDTDRFEGKALVCFEELYENDLLLMTHADINDEDQTVYVPSVRTNAYGADTMSDIVALGQRARITDSVFYENLLPGRQYTVHGSLYWMYTDDSGYVHSGPVAALLGDAQGYAAKVFTANGTSGVADVEFVVDTAALSELVPFDRLVVMEELHYNGVVIAKHRDLNDEGQTVYLPSLRTTAADGATGGKILTSAADASITDRVYYHGLQPGREYTVVGSVQYVVTDEQGNVASTGTLIQGGQEVKAQITFVPQTSEGYVDMSFTVNALELEGVSKLVVFEELYAAAGIRVAVHADINDEDQTLTIASLGSFARTEDGGRSLSPNDEVVIIDTVYYEGLSAGTEYRMETDIMNASTGLSDVHCTTVFTPESSSGSIDIPVRFDGSGYTGEKLVVFESVYDNRTGVLVKSHRDWNELSQTITFVPQTGLAYDRSYREAAFKLLALCIASGIVWSVIPKKKKDTEKNR